MTKRILAAIGVEPAARGALAWAVEIARSSGASLTVVPMVDPDSWKRELPAVMAAGYAARLLEQRPWEDPPVRMRDLEAWCGGFCGAADVECSFSQPARHPVEWLARLSQSHDLLVFSGGEDAAAEVERGLASPLLAVPNETRPVENVLAAYSGSPESAGALKQYVQMRLWPEAPLRIVCAHHDAGEAEALLSGLGRFCRAHGYAVRLEHLDGDISALLDHVDLAEVDLLAGAASHRALLRAGRPVFMSH